MANITKFAIFFFETIRFKINKQDSGKGACTKNDLTEVFCVGSLKKMFLTKICEWLYQNGFIIIVLIKSNQMVFFTTLRNNNTF